jgi:hypothetical protein
MARHSGGGFFAVGSPGFVAGAAIGAGIGEAIRANEDFNDCMAANGWVVADPKPVSTALATSSNAPQAIVNTSATEPTPAPSDPCTKEDENMARLAREQGYQYHSGCN